VAAGTDVNFIGNSLVNSPAQHKFGKPLTTTETSTFKYKFGWDPYTLSASLAGALQFARDWGQLVHETNHTVAVRHDFESPWYGLSFYNVLWDAHARSFSWMREGWREQPHTTAADRFTLRQEWFEPSLSNMTDPFSISSMDMHEGEWVTSPTAIAMRWLARCGVDRALVVGVSPPSNTHPFCPPDCPFGGTATFACRVGSTLAITIINTDPMPHFVELASQEFRFRAQSVIRTTLAAQESYGLSTRTPNITKEAVNIAGDSHDGLFASWPISGYSMQRLDLALEADYSGAAIIDQ
jgi:hypothetical protein